MTLQAPNRRVSGLQTRERASPHYHGLGGPQQGFPVSPRSCDDHAHMEKAHACHQEDRLPRVSDRRQRDPLRSLCHCCSEKWQEESMHSRVICKTQCTGRGGAPSEQMTGARVPYVGWASARSWSTLRRGAAGHLKVCKT